MRHAGRFAGEDLLRTLAPQVLAAIIRRFPDFAAAEDAVQEALIAAFTTWPTKGVPQNPKGWLIHVATRRMQDHVRSEIARRRREADWAPRDPAQEWEDGVESPIELSLGEIDAGAGQDDTLVLLFMCCHPALARSSAVALTLRAVGGLTTAEIANAYMVPEATMAQRITRAKQRIKASGIPFSMPTEGDRAARLSAVLHVLYLIFNESYVSSAGPKLQRTDLSEEAIRLTRLVYRLLPDDTEVAGLLSLMLLTDARRAARTTPDGLPIPLAEQDRSLWDRRMIQEGTRLITQTLTKGRVGPYQLQAAIAALHDEAPCAEATDWPQILALYGLLKQMSDNPMVDLNHAVAAAMVHGAAAGLKLLEPLDRDARVAGHFRLAAVRAHFYEMLGQTDAAVDHYRAAAAQTRSIPERNYLLAKAARLTREQE